MWIVPFKDPKRYIDKQKGLERRTLAADTLTIQKISFNVDNNS